MVLLIGFRCYQPQVLMSESGPWMQCRFQERGGVINEGDVVPS